MDALVDQLFSIKDSLQDGLLVLPHLLSGFFFFVGILTSNIGMLCLAFGHFIIVPSLSYYANTEWSYYSGNSFNVGSLAYSILPTLPLLVSLLGSLWPVASVVPVLYILKAIHTAFGFQLKDGSLFDTINPYLWFNSASRDDKSSIDLCFLSPEERFSKDGVKRRSPSGWVIHLLFFTGFLIANASRIYALPYPTFKKTGDAKQDAATQAQLDSRVNNRKTITATVMGMGILLAALLLYVRFTMSPCEAPFYETVVPMLLCFFFGYAFYTLLTDSCGIPASDILGLVQGFINPEAITNPIVCIGSDGIASPTSRSR